MASEKITSKITVYGSAKDIADAKAVLLVAETGSNEAKDRLVIAKIIADHKIKADILYDGNTVWNKDKLLKNLRSMVKSNNMELMNDYMYKFLSLSCGSIAHNNKYGWICEYPTIAHLREFFRHNEMPGQQSVLKYQPHWKTDAIEIVKEMNKILGVRV